MADLRRIRTIQKTSKALKVHVIAAYLVVLLGCAVVVFACVGPVLPLLAENDNEQFIVGPWTFEAGIVHIKLLIFGGAVFGFGFFYRSILAFVVWWHHG